MRQALCVVTDLEVEGPVPGRHSRLAFASVAIDEAGTELGAVLAPLPEARPDPETTACFESHPAATARRRATRPRPPRPSSALSPGSAGLAGSPASRRIRS